jgi:starvation-inducible DNA-binding protein
MILHLVVGMKDRLQVVVTECGKTVENLGRPNVETMSDFKTMFLNNDIDIPEETRARIVDMLNLRLADAVDLQTKAKHAHWNVKGTEFFALHQLFAIAGRCAQHSDLIAERVTALGGVAGGTVRLVAQNSSIPDYDLDATVGQQHIRALAKGIARFGAELRTGIDSAEQLGDKGTADLLTEVVRQVDKDLWLLEAHLQCDSLRGLLEPKW